MASYEPTGYHNEAWDYRIYLDGATYFAIPGDTGSGLSALQNATIATLLQATHDALPATGGTIYLDGDFLIAGRLSVTKSRFRLVRNKESRRTALGTAYLRDVLIDSNAGDIEDLYFEGIQFRQISFYARGGNHIREVRFDGCRLNSADSDNRRGILLNSDGNSGEFVDGVIFDRLVTSCGNDAAGEGSLITVIGGSSAVGNSLWRFNNCRIGAPVSSTLIMVQDGGYLDRVLFDGHTSFEQSDLAQPLIFVDVADQTNTLRGIGVEVTNCTLEWDSNMTLFQTAASTESLRAYVDFHQNVIFVSATMTLTVMNNLNANWAAQAGRSGFTFKNNRVQMGGGTFTVGTTGAHANFPVDFQRNPGYNAVGNIATPYPAGAGLLLDVAAAQAFPASAVDYLVAVSPKLIVLGPTGTFTSVNIDGVPTGQVGAGTPATVYRLEPGQVLNVVWTVQPTSVVYAC